MTTDGLFSEMNGDAAPPPRHARSATARPGSTRLRRAFTLIELLAAMAILSILVVIMGRIFSDSTNVWRIGAKKVESNSTGRSALDFMARELSSMLCDERISMKLESNADTYLGLSSDRIKFLSMTEKAEQANGERYRDSMQVVYYVAPITGVSNRFAIYRGVAEKVDASTFSAYQDTDWWNGFAPLPSSPAAGILAENVRNFEVWVYDRTGTPRPNYSSKTLGPPLWIDLYLEVLAEEDATKAGYVSDPQFIETATRRYHVRVYPENRLGYAGD
jgi:prepilin-type N-terminal cleavage/methylation domain-containing protein